VPGGRSWYGTSASLHEDQAHLAGGSGGRFYSWQNESALRSNSPSPRFAPRSVELGRAAGVGKNGFGKSQRP